VAGVAAGRRGTEDVDVDGADPKTEEGGVRAWYDDFTARWRAWLFQKVADSRVLQTEKRPQELPMGRTTEVAGVLALAKQRRKSEVPPTGRAREIAEAEEQAMRRWRGKARAVPGEVWEDDSEEEDGRGRDDGGRGGGGHSGPGRAEPGAPT